MSSSKVLVLNPALSTLNKILKKENSLHSSSGPFDFVLLLGDVLDVEDVPTDLLEVNAQTFFTEGINLISKSKDGKQISNNLQFLGKIGVHEFENGIKLGYVTGDLTDVTPTQLNETFSGKKLDILISYHWPSAISQELKLTLFGNAKIDTVVKLTKPRYHFACGSENGKFHERSPIFWGDELRVTRFVSLGQYGNKERFHYAFNMNLDSSKDLENMKTDDDNPFTIKPSKQVEVQQKRPAVEEDDHEEPETKQKAYRKQKLLVTPNQCFFCLSNPNIETHMIISIGEKCYLTIAKGPLTRPHKNLLKFSGHGIIIPVSHAPTLLASMESENVTDLRESGLFKEINLYKQNIVQMFKKIDPSFKVVFFEISRQKSIHYHIQFVPILSKYVDKFDSSLNKLLANNGKFPRNYKFQFNKVDNEEQLVKLQADGEYMLISIWDSPSSQVNYISEIKDAEGLSVDLQFPRRVLANVLNDHRRVYWDKCKQSTQKETEDCEDFKEAFKDFDFTLQ